MAPASHPRTRPGTPRSGTPGTGSIHVRPRTPLRPTSSPASSATRILQDDMKKVLAKELGDSIFQFPNLDILLDIFKLPQEIVENKIAGLNYVNNFPPILKAPVDLLLAYNGDESGSYPLLAGFMKAILKWAKDPTISNMRMLKMADTSNTPLELPYEPSAGLKPDSFIVEDGISSAPTWFDSYCVVEFKKTWSDLLLQANTYARAMFTTGNRWYVLVTGYNQKDRDFRFLFYTRVGLFVTPLISLKTGVSHIARVFVALSVLEKERLGYQLHIEANVDHTKLFLPHIYDNRTLLPGGKWYQEDRNSGNLNFKKAIKGRATRVSVLKLHYEGRTNTADIIPATALIAPGAVHTTLESKTVDLGLNADSWWGFKNEPTSRVLRSGNLLLWSSLPQPTPTPTHVKELSVFLYKDSWPLADRSLQETMMLQSISGKHGAPQISVTLLSYHHMHKFWNFSQFDRCSDWQYSSKECRPLVEKRTHTRIILHTEGLSVSNLVDKPTELVRVILDVAICEYSATSLCYL